MTTPHARNIVRKLLAGGQSLRVQELYARGLSEFPATPFPPPPPPKQYLGKKGIMKPVPPQPPNPGHPFRSHSYLKGKVLTELVETGEIERYHTHVEASPNASQTKRKTRSKGAIADGKEDIWLWRLTGEQAKNPEPLLEDEPPVVDRHNWYLPNTLFPPINEPAKRKSTKTTYGAGRFDHLNDRRESGRPLKEQRQREWEKVVEAARAEGAQSAAT